jgi:hypothetical protein
MNYSPEILGLISNNAVLEYIGLNPRHSINAYTIAENRMVTASNLGHPMRNADCYIPSPPLYAAAKKFHGHVLDMMLKLEREDEPVTRDEVSVVKQACTAFVSAYQTEWVSKYLVELQWLDKTPPTDTTPGWDSAYQAYHHRRELLLALQDAL